MIDKNIFFNLLILFFTIYILINLFPKNNILLKLKKIYHLICLTLKESDESVLKHTLRQQKNKKTKNVLNKYLISHINEEIAKKTNENIKRNNGIIDNPLSDIEFNIIHKYLKTILNNKKNHLKLVSINKNNIKKQILNNDLLYKNINCKCLFYDLNVVISIQLVATEMSKDSIFLGPVNMGSNTGVYNIIKISIDKFNYNKKKSITKPTHNFKIKYGDTDKEPVLLTDSIDSLLPDSFKEGYNTSYDTSSITENHLLV